MNAGPRHRRCSQSRKDSKFQGVHRLAAGEGQGRHVSPRRQVWMRTKISWKYACRLRSDRRFGTFPSELIRLRMWLVSLRTTEAALESTGVYAPGLAAVSR